MKIEELNPKQSGKARALETNEERLDYLRNAASNWMRILWPMLQAGKTSRLRKRRRSAA